ncbi:MAG: hypothetical protein WC544_01205 [Patescibacteria group bacterium]
MTESNDLALDLSSVECPEECITDRLSEAGVQGIIVVTSAGIHHYHAVYALNSGSTRGIQMGIVPVDGKDKAEVERIVTILANGQQPDAHFVASLRHVPLMGIRRAGKFVVGLIKKGESLLCQTDRDSFLTSDVCQIIVVHAPKGAYKPD